jgi:hypothetical protein
MHRCPLPNQMPHDWCIIKYHALLDEAPQNRCVIWNNHTSEPHSTTCVKLIIPMHLVTNVAPLEIHIRAPRTWSTKLTVYLNGALYGITCISDLVTNIALVHHTTWSTIKIVNMDHQTYRCTLTVHINAFNDKCSTNAPNNIEHHVRCLFSDKVHRVMVHIVY